MQLISATFIGMLLATFYLCTFEDNCPLVKRPPLIGIGAVLPPKS